MNPISPSAILVVEDDGLIALQLWEFLKKAGYTLLDPLASGEEALECLRRLPAPDIILIDIALSGKMDGIETMKKIREFSEVPVLFIIAMSDEKTIGRTEDIHPAGFILKPLIENEVLSKIDGVLTQKIAP